MQTKPALDSTWTAGTETAASARQRDEVARLKSELAAAQAMLEGMETILEIAAPGGWEWDLTTDAVRCHEHWAGMLGYTLDELAPVTLDTWRSLVHPDDVIEAEAAMRTHIRGDSALSEAIFRMHHKHGHWLWIQNKARVVAWHDNGEPSHMAGAHTDITALRRAELEAAESRERLQAVIDASDQVAIIATDAHGTITLFNPGAERLLGYSANEVIGHHTPEIFHDVQELCERVQCTVAPDGGQRGVFESLIHQLKQAPSTDDWLFVDKAGGRKRVRLSINSTRNGHGEHHGFVGIAVDLTPLLLAQQQARMEAEKFTGAFNSTALGMALVSLEGRWIEVNDALCSMLGYSREELLRLDFQTLTHPDDLATDLAQVRDLLAGRVDHYHLEKRYVARSGRFVWGKLSVSLVRGDNSMPLHFVSQIQDITREKTSLQLLRESEQHTRVTLDAVTDIIITVDNLGVVQYVNATAQQMLAPEAQAKTGLVGRSILSVLTLTSEDSPRHLIDLSPLLDDTDDSLDRADDLLMPADGRLIPVDITRAGLKDEHDRYQGSVWVIRDVTERRQRRRETLRMAEIDPLTELANRRGFAGRLDDALARLRQKQQPSSLLYMDLDGFKSINDTYGHQAGDLMLQHVASLLRNSVRDVDIVARLGGDEFAVILLGCALKRAERIGEEIRSGICRIAVPWQNATLTTHVSIGITALHAEMNSEQALAAADAQCYRAKSLGKDNVQIADELPQAD